MNMQPQSETPREVIVISKILADLVRTFELIESDIAAEEERAKISDRSQARHPMLANSLIERRDNIKMTIAALEERERAQHEQAATADYLKVFATKDAAETWLQENDLS